MTIPQSFGLSVIRSAAQQAVAESSLRAVAEEIGMSFSALKEFLDGATIRPHRPTAEKLARWYAGRGKRKPQLSRAEVDAAVAVLLTYIRSAANTATAERRRRALLERLSE
jgi:hypothetical protein